MTTPQIVATVELYTEADLTYLIIGGSLGGFVLLALITAGLIKVKLCRALKGYEQTARIWYWPYNNNNHGLENKPK